MCQQMLEIIFINGGKDTISETPLLPKSFIEKTEDFSLSSTGCYRGYRGTWEIKDNKLYLKDIAGQYKLKDNNSPVFANWYTGKLHIPGHLYSSYGSIVEIKKGIVISIKDRNFTKGGR